MRSHEDLVEWYRSWETETQTERELAERDRDYYDGNQWTEEERAVLEKRGQPIVTVNRLAPKVNFILGTEIRIRTDPKAEPRTPMDTDVADAATDIIRYVCEEQSFDQKRTRAFRDLFLEGICAGEVCVKRKRNDVQIKIERLPWDRIVYDPYASLEDFSDGKFKGSVVWMDAEDALVTWGDKADIIEATQISAPGSNSGTHGDKPSSWWDPSRKRLLVTQLYWKEMVAAEEGEEGEEQSYRAGEAEEQWMCATFTGAGFLEEPKLSPYLDEYGDTECPFVFQACYIDRKNAHYGVLRNLIPIQDEINKRRSKALHIVNLRQTTSTLGAFEDIQGLKSEMAKPDAHIEVPSGMNFEILPTNDMAAQQFNLLAESKSEIDMIGPSAAATGHDNLAISGRSRLVAQQSGQTEMEPVFDGARNWQKNIYKLVFNRAKQYWPMRKYIRVRDSDKNIKFVELNVPVTKRMLMIEQAEAQGIVLPPEVLADPSMDEVVEKRNDVAMMDMDITLGEAPDTASLRHEQYETLAELAGKGIPIPPEVIIEASSIRNKKELLDKMRGSEEEKAQQAQQAQVAQQAMMQMQALEMATGQAKIQETNASAAQKQATAESTTLNTHIKAAQAGAALRPPSPPPQQMPMQQQQMGPPPGMMPQQ
jgi:hypothetical protein